MIEMLDLKKTEEENTEGETYLHTNDKWVGLKEALKKTFETTREIDQCSDNYRYYISQDKYRAQFIWRTKR